MKIIISIFSLLLLFSTASFGQKTFVKATNCYDLKVKKFNYVVAKSANKSGTQVSVTFKVKNIGTYDYTGSNAATLKLYAITGSKKNMVESWNLDPIDATKFEEYSWGRWYIPIETLPTQFEAIINFNGVITGDCNNSNNSRIQDL